MHRSRVGTSISPSEMMCAMWASIRKPVVLHYLGRERLWFQNSLSSQNGKIWIDFLVYPAHEDVCQGGNFQNWILDNFKPNSFKFCWFRSFARGMDTPCTQCGGFKRLLESDTKGSDSRRGKTPGPGSRWLKKITSQNLLPRINSESMN